MISKIKNILRSHAVNVRGWRTNRKIVVIESDDWGAIRLPSVEHLEKLKTWGIKTEKDYMLRNDALASEEDLQRLFDLLKSIPLQDNSTLPVITANTITANPDFDKIKVHGFKNYHFEPFTETLKRYPSHQNAFHLWNEAMSEGLFHPQFHGREHLHVRRWMNGLQNRASETSRLFEEKIYAVCGSASTEKRESYLAAYEWDTEEDRVFTIQSIREGLNLFETLFGFRSRSAIAPNYTWHRELERAYSENGVQFLQGGTVQRSPDIESGENINIRHYIGERNENNQRYLIRNCRFEPSSNPGFDWVENCMEEIKTAFLWKKPAIIESHRVNFIGYIDPKNRDRNLKLLDELLRKIVNTWPDVEFMTSDQLGVETNKAT